MVAAVVRLSYRWYDNLIKVRCCLAGLAKQGNLEPLKELSLMRTIHIVYIVFSLTTGLCALVAARYWYLSSRPAPTLTDTPDASIGEAPELHILGTQVDLYSIQSVLAEASSLNKKAAAWSAIAALLGAITSLLGIL